MDRTREHIDRDRRRFFGSAALTFAATQVGLLGSALGRDAADDEARR